jgi:hypothetical protein
MSFAPDASGFAESARHLRAGDQVVLIDDGLGVLIGPAVHRVKATVEACIADL